MNALEDRELVEVLVDRPDLLAIADAVAVTQPRRRRAPRRAVTVAAVAAVVGAFALAAPWGARGPDMLDRALAAIGSGPVMHAVVEYSADDAIVDLATGESRPRVHRMEFWYDEGRLMFRSRLSTDGVPLTEQVVTPGRSCSDVGCVDTGEMTAHLEPTLSGFATGYRESLASGEARVTGEARVDGRDVTLLTFERPSGERTTVAVDASTHRPLRFSSTYPGGRRSPIFTVRTIESLPRAVGLFVPPALSAPRPSTGLVQEAVPIALGRAASELGAPPVWLGPSFDGQSVDAVQLSRAVMELSDGRKVPGKVVRVRYGPVRVSMAFTPAGAYVIGMENGDDPPAPAGSIAVTHGFGRYDAWEGELRSNGLYVSISAPTRDQLLKAARSLRPSS